ncbi:MAG: type II toxin-antitoxin system HicA family toxin [Bacteroidetes bacterium]|nr:type II toxin-antitoxin system HicA family toxin [Bacteroidota bacterium]
MPTLPIVKPTQAIKALKRAGFYIHHQTGSHARLLHKTKPELRVTIPGSGTFLFDSGFMLIS